MPQTKLDVEQVKNNAAAADKLKKEGEALDKVKWVNVHQDTGVVLITHEDGFDASAFQAVVDGL